MVRPMVPTGIGILDDLLQGGLPVGAITEIAGGLSSGRTACAQAFVAQMLRRGGVGAWVDASDSFDAESAAANGVDLRRLLWVRCGGKAEQPCQEGLTAEQRVCAVHTTGPVVGGGGSPHPRNEVRGLPEAVDAFLTRGGSAPVRQAKAGTPGAPNRRLGPIDRTEQVASDRQPARRGQHVLEGRLEARCVASQRRERSTGGAGDVTGRASMEPEPRTQPQRRGRMQSPGVWDRLDQALRSADLLMQAGGFGVMVLDLGGIAPECVNRVPPATWFRFRAAADKARSSFLLLTRHPSAQSSAEMVLRARAACPADGTVLTGIPIAVEILRQRFTPAANKVVSMRRPPQRSETDRAMWSAPTVWVGGR